MLLCLGKTALSSESWTKYLCKLGCDVHKGFLDPGDSSTKWCAVSCIWTTSDRCAFTSCKTWVMMIGLLFLMPSVNSCRWCIWALWAWQLSSLVINWEINSIQQNSLLQTELHLGAGNYVPCDSTQRRICARETGPLRAGMAMELKKHCPLSLCMSLAPWFYSSLKSQSWKSPRWRS